MSVTRAEVLHDLSWVGNIAYILHRVIVEWGWMTDGLHVFAQVILYRMESLKDCLHSVRRLTLPVGVESDSVQLNLNRRICREE